MAITTARPPRRVTVQARGAIERSIDAPRAAATVTAIHHNHHKQTAVVMGTIACSLVEQGEIAVAKRMFELAAAALAKIPA